MKTEQRKQSFTRAEVVAALAEPYRAEQEKSEELARETRLAAHAGEAAEYSRLDAAFLRQQDRMDAMIKMVSALDIEQSEFMAVVNRERPGP